MAIALTLVGVTSVSIEFAYVKETIVTDKCLVCSEVVTKQGNRYCSHTCQMEYQFREYIKRWKNGKEIGHNCMGMVTNPVKRYLRGKYNDSCAECGWSKINPFTGKVPLVADHINGDWHDSSEDNLRLLCGCCDSLTATYGGANKGRGRTLNGKLR